jgi:hypothetical protein
MTAPWRRSAAQEGASIDLCDFYEGFDKEGTNMSLSGIYSLEDMKAFGNDPFFRVFFLRIFGMGVFFYCLRAFCVGHLECCLVGISMF